VPEKKMAGDTSVNSSTPRHGQLRVADARDEPAKPAPAKPKVTPGHSGLDVARQESRLSQNAANEKANAYLQADARLSGDFARIDGSSRSPKQKTAEKTQAIISVARLHEEAVAAENANVETQDSLKLTLHPRKGMISLVIPEQYTELNSAQLSGELLDTALAHAQYTEFHVKELYDQLVDAKTSGVTPDATLTRNYKAAVRDNLAGWRVASNNALLAADHAQDIRNDLAFCQKGLKRAELLANGMTPPQIATKSRQELDEALPAAEALATPLQIAKEARLELNAKSRQIMLAKAQLPRIPGEKKIAVETYLKTLEGQRKQLAINNYKAWDDAIFEASHRHPKNDGELRTAGSGFNEARGFLADLVPELFVEAPDHP
jgi:hypothetical protein